LSLSFANSYYKVDNTIQALYPEPACDAYLGFAYMIWHVESQYALTLDFKRYPLDVHSLKIMIEDNIYPSSDLQYIIDKTTTFNQPSTGLSPQAKLSGWRDRGFTEEVIDFKYDTNFGAKNELYAESTYSRYVFVAKIGRGASVFFMKTLPPLLITLFIAGMAFLLDIESMETRLGTAVSALLTEVFLQLFFASNVPQSADYLTLVDWIFLVCYIEIFLIIIECITMRRLCYRWELAERRENEKQHELDLLSPENRERALTEKALKEHDHHKHSSRFHGKSVTKTKIWIEALEDVFFGFFITFTVLLLLIVSLIGKYA